MTTSGDDSSLAWEVAFWSLAHPTKVAILEAFLWIGEPLSAVALTKVLDQEADLSTVAYHVRRLAEAGALVPDGSKKRRGALEFFFVLAR